MEFWPFGLGGPRGDRPKWLNTHYDGADGIKGMGPGYISGYKLLYPFCSCKGEDGRKDHFVTNATSPTLAIIYEFLGFREEDCLNDLAYNFLGREFGYKIRHPILFEGIYKDEVGQWIKKNLCEKQDWDNAGLR